MTMPQALDSTAIRILSRRKDPPNSTGKTLDLSPFDSLRKHQAALLAGHMLLDGVPLATIRFITKVYPLLLQVGQSSAKALADHFGCSPQSASKHVTVLTDFNYLSRVHYRAWEINAQYLAQLSRAH